jgi:hypothetical protein
VAVLDIGVDLNHPDLVNNLLPGFDATGNNSAGAPTGNTGDAAHGTACAGIIAAQANNAIGIAGVAYSCRILPVRITNRSTGWSTTESQFITNGINWARQNGADVISMSFGCIETNALNTAITSAVNIGRNNNGCVLVAASGNGNASTVGYPARLENVIAVGAISQCGQRKSPTSCDGETTWGSNYGTALDVVAPGVKIYTTDIEESAGYNTSAGTSGNYFANFNGTSSATPHVAGIAALILSVRPDLTQAQVRRAIESTCKKLSGYTYSNNSAHPNGTWNGEVGHGLVDAYAAVYSVVPRISGPTLVCSGSSKTFTASNWQSGFSWGSSSNLSRTGNGASVTFTGSGNAAGWVSIMFNGAEIVRHNVWVGKPNFSLLFESLHYGHFVAPSSYFTAEFYYYTPLPTQCITTTNWSVAPAGSAYLTYQSPTFTRVNAPPLYGNQSPINGTVTATAYNTCGSSQATNFFVVTNDVSPIYVSIYPNPASDILHLEFDEEAIAQIKALEQSLTKGKRIMADMTYDFRLYDGQGNLLRYRKAKGGSVQFNVANLPNGIYYLHIYNGISEKPAMRQIVVEH